MLLLLLHGKFKALCVATIQEAETCISLFLFGVKLLVSKSVIRETLTVKCNHGGGCCSERNFAKGQFYCFILPPPPPPLLSPFLRVLTITQSVYSGAEAAAVHVEVSVVEGRAPILLYKFR